MPKRILSTRNRQIRTTPNRCRMQYRKGDLSMHRSLLSGVIAISLLSTAGITLSLAAAPGPARSFQLQADLPQFWRLVGHDAKLDVVATGFGFTEGPMWDERSGFLYVSDETLN